MRRIFFSVALMLPILLCCAVPLKAGAIIADERIQLARTGLCAAGARRVFFGNQPAVIEGASVKAATGAPLYAGAERVLDAATYNLTDFILSESSITVRQGKKAQSISLGGRYTSGGLLFTRPDFLIYFVSRPTETLFFTQTPTKRRLYFAADADFVSARLDNFGNTIVAYKNRLLAINKSGQEIPLFLFKDEIVEGLEVSPADNGLLLDTQRGLLKITDTKKLYTLLVGDGRLETLNQAFFWCDSAGERYALSGEEAVGKLASDKAYVKTLLMQASKLMSLGLPEKAFQKYVKVLEIMPREPRARRLVVLLARKLRDKKSA